MDDSGFQRAWLDYLMSLGLTADELAEALGEDPEDLTDFDLEGEDR
jgi:hypothetical protein